MKKTKVLLTLACVVLLVAASVMGTLAYLTAQDTVVNCFSVGSVSLSLDEQDVDNSTASAARDKANTYHLLPGHEYIKDPIVHVNTTSEDSWIFVKVENGITAYEAATSNEANGYKTIADQIAAQGWTKLDNVDNVYYKEYTKNANGADLVVFEKFKIADDANNVDGWATINTQNTKINVIAYAVQKDGFGTASAAWNATFGASQQ